MDPKKLLGRLEQIRRDRPFRYLGRRVVRAMAEAATENPLVGQRSAPGRYLVVRLVGSEEEREQARHEVAQEGRLAGARGPVHRRDAALAEIAHDGIDGGLL